MGGLKPVLLPTPPVTLIASALKVEPPETTTALGSEESTATLHPGTLTEPPPLTVRPGCAVRFNIRRQSGTPGPGPATALARTSRLLTPSTPMNMVASLWLMIVSTKRVFPA